MVDGLRLVGLSVADAAKTSEQIGAVLLFLFLGVGTGTIFFGIVKARDSDPQPASGLILAALFGSPVVAVSLPMGQTTVPPVITILALIVLFLV